MAAKKSQSRKSSLKSLKGEISNKSSKKKVDILIDTEESILERFMSSSKKIVIFGTRALILRNMTRQLKKEGHYVAVVKKSERIKATVNRAEPDLVLLQLDGYKGMTLDKIVLSLGSFLERKADAFGDDPQRVHIVIYKVEEKASNVSVLTEDVKEVQRLLKASSLYGNMQYLGLYNSVSFLRKINQYLNTQS